VIRNARIAVVTNVFPLRSETFVVDQVGALLSQGAEIVVFCDYIGDPGTMEAIGLNHERMRVVPWPKGWLDVIRCCYRGQSARPGLFSLQTLIDHIRAPMLHGRWATLGVAGLLAAESPFDVLIAHFGPNGDCIATLKERFGLPLPLATVLHGYDVSRYLQERGVDAYAALRRSGDYFLPVSGFWAAKLVSLGFPQDKISVQHMGIDFRKFNGARSAGSEGTIRIVSVGRFVEKKGFDLGIRAVSTLLAEGHDIEYLIAGDGPLKDQSAGLVTALGTGDRIRFIGWKKPDEIDQLLRTSDLLLAPSVAASDGDMEGIPVVLMEAMASRTLVVSTRHSGIPELVQHGVTGWLADEGSVASLTDALRHALASRTDWDRVRANARAKIEAEFNWERLAADLVQLLCPRLTPPSTPPTVDQISPPASATASAVAMSAHPPQS
jgi:colanic acid/amylovoran biosynthesis glycosyltransferase